MPDPRSCIDIEGNEKADNGANLATGGIITVHLAYSRDKAVRCPYKYKI